MKNIVFIILLTIIPYKITHSQCVLNESNVVAFTYNGKNYEIVKENLTWTNASACAVERGGYLAEIDSQEEQDTIFYQVNNAGISSASTSAADGGGSDYLWIGANDFDVEGRWVWNGNNDGVSAQFWQGTTTGSPVGGLYNNWGNEPDDFGSGQDGLGFALNDWPLGVAGQWNDVDDSNSLYYIIEYPPTGNVGLNENEDSKINLYPNPVNEFITLSIPQNILDYQNLNFKIFQSNGKIMDEANVSDLTFQIDVSNYPNGNYYLIIDDKTFEFIVQH